MSKKIYGGLSIQNAQEIGFFDADSSNFIALKAPSTLSGNTTLNLPNGDSTGTQALVSNGSGTLSWASFLSTTLADGRILIGNGSNVATAVDVTGDVTISNAGVTAIAAGVIVDADINASAAISLSKLAAVTASRALVSNGSGFITASSVTSTELGYVSGVTSAIQTQLNNLSSLIQNFEWQESVLDRVTVPAGGEVAGDRYLVIATATGAFAGQENKIAEYDGASWAFTSPTTGMFVGVDDETDGLYVYGGSSWTKKYFEATTASTGLTKVGFDIRLDAPAAGAGLGFSAGVLAVNVDDVGIEINTDALRLKDGGITNAKINASAAIAYSKLSLSDSIVNADINSAAAIAYSKLNLSGSIVNADINASAAIAYSKLAALTASRALVSDGSGFVSASAVTSTELGYVSGVTSAIQTQINTKAARALDNLQVTGLAAQSLLVGASGTAVQNLSVGSEGQVLKVVSGAVAWATPSTVGTYSADWVTADGASLAITHSLGSKDVMVQIYDKTDDATIEIDSVVRTSTNVVTVTASSAPPAAGWRVLIVKM